MRILLVIDYSPESARAVREVAGRSWPHGTVARVLAVVPRTPPSQFELWFDALGCLRTVMAMRKERAEALVSEAATVMRAGRLAVDTSVRIGSMRRAIKAEAKESSADLVIKCYGAWKSALWKHAFGT